MLLLDDDEIFKRAKLLRNHGRSTESLHDIIEASPKYMPNNLGAALGYAQFTRLKELIEDESEKKPLSDDKLTKILASEGFNVARRTVAKYREVMGIPVARLRRKIGVK